MATTNSSEQFMQKVKPSNQSMVIKLAFQAQSGCALEMSIYEYRDDYEFDMYYVENDNYNYGTSNYNEADDSDSGDSYV